MAENRFRPLDPIHTENIVAILSSDHNFPFLFNKRSFTLYFQLFGYKHMFSLGHNGGMLISATRDVC